MGMTRIEKKFQELQKKNQKALVTFVTAGDPSLSQTEKIVLQLEKSGADIIELGIPFTDPMADGPVIQLSSERSLKKGTTLPKILDLVAKLRQKTEIPLLLMGYFNPIHRMGLERFAKEAVRSGVDAVLVVDLPVEESEEFHKILKKHKINLVYLLTPTSDLNRVKKVSRVASGFIYYVSMTGITGAKLSNLKDVDKQVQKIKKTIRLPVCVGFGISKASQAKELSKKSDGVVVGSAIIKLLAQKNQSSQQKLKSLAKFIQSLKKSLS